MEIRKLTTTIYSLACICLLQLKTHVYSWKDEDLLFHVYSLVLSMECFKCPISLTLTECKEKQFVDQCIFGYTTCFTQIKYAAGTKRILNVTKSCVDDTFCERELKATNNEDCEVRNDNNYDCVWCCHDDKCNEHSGGQSVKVNSTHTIVVTIVAVLCFYIQNLQAGQGFTLMKGR